MPLIPAPPAAPDKETLALRVDRDLHDRVVAEAPRGAELLDDSLERYRAVLEGFEARDAPVQ